MKQRGDWKLVVSALFSTAILAPPCDGQVQPGHVTADGSSECLAGDGAPWFFGGRERWEDEGWMDARPRKERQTESGGPCLESPVGVGCHSPFFDTVRRKCFYVCGLEADSNASMWEGDMKELCTEGYVVGHLQSVDQLQGVHDYVKELDISGDIFTSCYLGYYYPDIYENYTGAHIQWKGWNATMNDTLFDEVFPTEEALDRFEYRRLCFLALPSPAEGHAPWKVKQRTLDSDVSSVLCESISDIFTSCYLGYYYPDIYENYTGAHIQWKGWNATMNDTLFDEVFPTEEALDRFEYRRLCFLALPSPAEGPASWKVKQRTLDSDVSSVLCESISEFPSSPLSVAFWSLAFEGLQAHMIPCVSKKVISITFKANHVPEDVQTVTGMCSPTGFLAESVTL
ncbi:unnamed protein product [Darwinula stevensoni]|uniref:Uncharacterized protein n=1 Tax=Darwinula stevensoni TaxID=69355 RepID=A0A7R8X4I9_9CRUS|nr:unnamed protein product [Darwinula stevensoni]CAG0886104.1 unnamed protein product [Darwinula stevensoni]